jgi:indole-3-glycerol phosphate synthase
VPGALSSILEVTRHRVAQLRRDQAALARAAARTKPAVPWLPAFRSDRVSVIAEVKRRSPSAGGIAESLAPAAHARAYVAGGATAISVLTEPDFFGGSLADLDAVRSSVSVPTLRKDFIIDEIQLYEARIHGASAVLLVVRALADGALADLRAAARELGLACLVEVHMASELERALRVAPEAIGINARDLETLRVDVRSSRSLLRSVPHDVLAVAESGLSSRADVEVVASWGADAVLVGTAIAKAGDPAVAVRALTGAPRQGRARESTGGAPAAREAREP